MKNLKDKIKNILNAIDGNKGLYMKDCSTNEILTINENRRFHAASTIKIAILYEALLQVQSKKRKLDDLYKLKSSDLIGGCGVLKLMHVGLAVTLEDLITLMITVSDNVATNILHDILGKDNINDSIQTLNIGNTFFARKLMIPDSNLYSYTTAKDLGILLNEFLGCKKLNEDIANKGLEILYKQQYNDRISDNLILCGNCSEYICHKTICPKCHTTTSNCDPIHLPFAHKTGEINGVVHDAGILTIKDKKIIIVCLTDNLSDNKQGILMEREIGNAIFDYFMK
ncbi:serine hydrolase [Marinisporobacter balticus]|uniref:Beta-lactamase class A n=1 Tax=Marinisporobacter balticus TaxID=2018667 RepID=A0A4R2KC45_9FIRM|nr:serine hydrolase [Marinisporobacter balticus]TCO71053.1 beta-lactamase class A [Marinisporobacter balticus]